LQGASCLIGLLRKSIVYYQVDLILGVDQAILGRYHKRYLMPFGEYVPLKSTFPFLEQLFGQWDEITPGGMSNVLPLGEARIGTMLCYEDMVPSAARSLVAGGANVLVSLADGSSFENPLTLRQHRLLAQARAIENRRYLIRCASTGESCIISPAGHIEERLPLQQDSMLIGDFALLNQPSAFSQTGDLLSHASIVAIVAFLLLRFKTAAQLQLARHAESNRAESSSKSRSTSAQVSASSS
jgi:apolipoprotein N-acyltransferase